VRRMFLLGFVTMSMAVACSDRSLNRPRVEQLIGNLDTFKEQAFFSFATEAGFTKGTIAYHCMARADVEAEPVVAMLLKSGWVTIDQRPTAVGYGDRANCPALILTAQGRDASRGWQSRPSGLGTGQSWSIAVGERKLLGVTGLTEGPDGATYAEFNWKWNPNSMGAQLRDSRLPRANNFFDRTRQGRAACRRWDDGWRCKVERIGTGLDDVGQFPAS
jgi:hypothetical protein